MPRPKKCEPGRASASEPHRQILRAGIQTLRVMRASAERWDAFPIWKSVLMPLGFFPSASGNRSLSFDVHPAHQLETARIASERWDFSQRQRQSIAVIRRSSSASARDSADRIGTLGRISNLEIRPNAVGTFPNAALIASASLAGITRAWRRELRHPLEVRAQALAHDLPLCVRSRA